MTAVTANVAGGWHLHAYKGGLVIPIEPGGETPLVVDVLAADLGLVAR